MSETQCHCLYSRKPTAGKISRRETLVAMAVLAAVKTRNGLVLVPPYGYETINQGRLSVSRVSTNFCCIGLLKNYGPHCGKMPWKACFN